MRLVLDTNIVVSGLLWQGTPARLLETPQKIGIELCTSRVLLAELARTLNRTKFNKVITASGMTRDDLVLGYAELTTIVNPVSIVAMIPNDPDDDHVLACALAAKADFIVSGDRHLLELGVYQDIRIVTANDAMQHIGNF